MRYIYLQPVGGTGEGILHYLCDRLGRIYTYPCRIAPSDRVPEDTYEPGRGQYNAAGIVEEIARGMPPDAEKILGVADVDMYAPGTNFVFGVAIGNASVISLVRLRPEYYGERGNEPLFKERALKEAVHELGHTFGRGHCPDVKCVMHFSNFLEDTDIKSADFCRVCLDKLVDRGYVKPYAPERD
ncbi:MAG: archaemetzincin family Zn-dependent metalloprotease [Candidatus Methanoperedens sp.]|nr:archaemetzincin family Zn-dependent metalloprotease [Candidatus Methanoperedens sp.]